MKKGVLWGVFWAAVLIVAFCAAFMLSIKLYIEPAYDYMTKENIEQQISDLKQQITDKDKKITELQDELDIYVNKYGEIEHMEEE